jgi:hypothetical protein
VLGGLCGTFSLVAAPRQDPQYQHRYLY